MIERKVDMRGYIQGLFDRIAPKYDLLNRINSFGLDLCWRQDLVEQVYAERPRLVLDLAAGTGDLSIMLARKGIKVVATDISIGMLELAVQKARRKGLENLKISVADALDLPFEDNHFDAVTCAFGVRNFSSILDSFKEAYRVLKPGGMVAILELCEPNNIFIRQGYGLHTRLMIPLMSEIIGGNSDAYRYLAKSISVVPQRAGMQGLMEAAGFQHTFYKVYPLGVCTLYVGYKPSAVDEMVKPALQKLEVLNEE